MTLSEKIKLYELLVLENRLRMPEKMKKFLEPRRFKFSWGGRGGGKSKSICKILLNKANQSKIKVLCAREIQLSIYDSVYSDLVELINELEYSDYKILGNEIINQKTDSIFKFVGLLYQQKKQSIKSYANFDICWIEEAQSISEGSLKILTPTIRKRDSEIWFSFNRLLPNDAVWKFKEQQEDSRKIEVEINIEDNPYISDVLQRDYLRAKELYEQNNNDDFPHTWKGEPEAFGDRTIIPLKFVDDAIQREIEGEGQIQVGVDVARYGKDRTVFFMRKGLKLIDYKIYGKTSVNEVVEYTIDFVNNDTSVLICVDDTGIGGGVTDYLEKFGFNAIGINNAEKAIDNDKYNNRISEMWFEFRKMLPEISLLPLQELKNELVTRFWKMDNKNRRCVESKDEYKKRGFKSPDLADALLLCYAKIEEYKPVFMDL